ncbi:MAG: class I tRNA ligase family protein, partial [Clostridia bacterium]|nr:class I tRNA ligase family protein [Clostridia bacterium]
KFRNTARYCLGNLDGFDPNNLVKVEEMLELDRWAITKLNELTKKCFAAYDNYDFHVVSHAINDFCVVELSSFYLDIIKDRLYCEEKNGLERRSAQTALWMILDTITKLFAPILCFTCDEIWLAMPHRAEDDARNVLFNDMNQPYAAYELADMASWDALIELRDGVNAALEKARAAKQIGKPLEAHVTLVTEGAVEELKALQAKFESQWADLFIVSDVEVSDDAELFAKGMETAIAGVRVLVEEAKGEKCTRCWKHHTSIGTENGHEELCPRCAAVVAKMA